jgi:hypothetical protein
MNKRLQAIFAAALLQATGASAGDLIDESRDVNSDAIIDVEIMNGVVTLSGWDENRFHITGELSDAAEGYDLREVAGGVRFEENIGRRNSNNCRARGNDCGANTQSDLDIRLPRNSVLRFSGTNIEVTVEGLYGSTDIELVNGDVYATDLRGTVKLETVNGDIDTNALDGRISLETVNGSIDDNGSAGSRLGLYTTNGDIDVNTGSIRVSAETTNGDIDIEAGAVDELEVSTVGGSLDAVATLNDAGEININSVSGRIELAIPVDTSARFNIQTAANGRITNELTSDEPERRNRYVNSRELDFTLNGGSGDVSVSTVTGNVTLRTR